MDTGVKKPKVSVMMPVYNGERYIADSIKSILGQTLTDFELLVINDGSIDNTVGVVKSFNDPRIRFIENETNLGTIKTRNRGLHEIRGEYIAMLDSDDIAHPKRFEKQVEFLDSHPDFGIVGSWVDLIDAEGKPLNASWKTNMEPEEIPIFLLFHTCFSFSAVMIRRSAMPEDGFREGYIPVEDFEIWIRILDKAKGYNLPEILTTYRIHQKSLSRQKADLQREVVNKILTSQLSRLGIKPSESELALHRTNDTYRGSDVLDFLSKREKWLLRLLESNKKNGLFDGIIFLRVASKLWLKSCKSNTSPGLKAWRIFWRSPLADNISVGDYKDLIKFFIKCLLRKDDR